jgi:hypothetical protein
MRMQLKASTFPRPLSLDHDQLPDARPAVPGMRQTVGATLLTAAMSLPWAGPVHAENAPERGFFGLKSLDYQDSQPGDPRIHVRATALTVVAPVSGVWSLGGTLTSDVISGASPAYHTSALGRMHDRRTAVDANATRYFSNGTLGVGVYESSESDYLSRGLSVKASRSSEDKNTTWTAGIGVNSDVINPINGIVVNETKHVAELLLGVTQVLTTHDIVQLSLGVTEGHGYFSDPYKIFDNRPRVHNSNTVIVRWNHHVESAQGTARFSYRYYSDNWGIEAHTMGVEYVQLLAQGWTVTPLARVYTQSAANFYVAADNGPFAPNLPADWVYYSEDQRVSAFGAHTLGLKVAKQISADCVLDVKFEQYGQRASWRLGGGGSPGLEPFNARSVQVGVSVLF